MDGKLILDEYAVQPLCMERIGVPGIFTFEIYGGYLVPTLRDAVD